jgi:capsular exopolysaccharide synthesis family protein
MATEQANLSFEQILGIVRRRSPWILLCFVLGAGVAYGVSKHQTKKYTATASLSFNNNSLSQQIAGLSPNNAGNSLLAQQASDLELVRVGDMAAKTAMLLGRGLTAERVSGSLSIAPQGESSVVDVSATASSPMLAGEIANTYTRQFADEQGRTNLQYFTSVLALVKKELARLSPAQRLGEDGLNLQNRAQTLSLLIALRYKNVDVAQEALAPASPSSPKTHKNTIIGGALGLFFGLGLAFLLERFDRRIRAPEDLETIYRLAILGAVPRSTVLSRSARSRGKGLVLPPAEAEAFGLIRAHLRFFHTHRDLRTVLIASAARGEGKTTIARHLAGAAARLGSRVLLLEADLRHPTLAQHLDIQAGPGLADVLTGDVPREEATQSVELEAPSDGGIQGRTFDVLPAGAVLPSNPGELLESHAMRTVLARVKCAYDLVVIDTPPLATVADAFALLSNVDGVVVVGRVGRSRRDTAERLRQILASSGAPVFGIIANGSKGGGAGSYAHTRRDRPPAPIASANGASPSEELVPTPTA